MKSEQDHKLSKMLIVGICLGCALVALLWFVQMDQWNAKEKQVEPSVQILEDSDVK